MNCRHSLKVWDTEKMSWRYARPTSRLDLSALCPDPPLFDRLANPDRAFVEMRKYADRIAKLAATRLGAPHERLGLELDQWLSWAHSASEVLFNNVIGWFGRRSNAAAHVRSQIGKNCIGEYTCDALNLVAALRGKTHHEGGGFPVSIVSNDSGFIERMVIERSAVQSHYPTFHKNGWRGTSFRVDALLLVETVTSNLENLRVDMFALGAAKVRLGIKAALDLDLFIHQRYSNCVPYVEHRAVVDGLVFGPDPRTVPVSATRARNAAVLLCEAEALRRSKRSLDLDEIAPPSRIPYRRLSA